MPPPSEASILSNFLLPPAPLPAIISLKDFTALFPAKSRSDAAIPRLYRELQQQRANDTDHVKDNIAAEVERGKAQRRQVQRARRRADRQQMHGVDEREAEMERELFGPSANAPARAEHTLQTLIPEMERACSDLDAEIAAMEGEADKLLREATRTIGDLSDLRYGRFNRTSGVGNDAAQELIDTLKALESAAVDVSKG